MASVHNEDDLQRFDRALDNYIRKIEMERTEPKYVKNGSTFFSNWQDFVDWAPTATAPPGGRFVD